MGCLNCAMGQQLEKLPPRRTEERIIRILIDWSSKALRDKLLERCYTVQRRLKVAAIVATDVELSSTSCNVARNKNVARQVAEVTCYTVQFFSNLCRNGVARQVAEKIAQCNIAFTVVCTRQNLWVPGYNNNKKMRKLSAWDNTWKLSSSKVKVRVL